MSEQQDLLAVLDRLEDVESRLLSWGVTGVNLSCEEVEGVIGEVLPDADVAVVLDALQQESLLLRVGNHYRTRAAETLRLLASLRQSFGSSNGYVKAVRDGDGRCVAPFEVHRWPEGRHLVSDYRFLAQPRAVPRRDRTPHDVLRRLDVEDGIRQALAGLMPDRLSRFQERSIQTILGWKNARKDQAAVVTAGTGAGKTYAFYLPVLSDLIAQPVGRRCPSVLAVYPRIELLKDQLQSVYEMCRRVDGLAASFGRRPLRIGALYGDVPKKAEWVGGPHGWKEGTRGGRSCPFLKCPACGGQVEWRDEDRARDVESLRCIKQSCGAIIPDGFVALTRDSLNKHPPDVLFLSMEMLNRFLQEGSNDRVIGGRGSAPRYVLLDEVHTYGGVSGAHNAYVLRRWRQRVSAKGRAVHWVGLSATLKRPGDFFHQLVPIGDSADVQCVAPEAVELDRLGKQYCLVLRGDPTSQAALLGVTIQALMLLARSCTVAREGAGRPDARVTLPSAWQRRVFGHKVFAFTDTLDVFSRLEGDLLDAESKHLPWLRATTTADGETRDEKQARFDAGQYWRLPERLGRDLGREVRIQSVSSKWAARDLAIADVVIATSSLEVGFDDDEVNVVLQHKAPRDWAAYLQRIGRAGRKIEMRPWAVTVLSDYGRDGQAYRNYHEFFEPALRYTPVPIDNTYVLRIQAAFATLDFIASKGSHGVGIRYGESLQKFLLERSKGNRTDADVDAICCVVQELLDDPDAYRRELAFRLRRKRSDPLLGDVMYRPPRSLLYEFLPSLLRQLRGHRRISEQGHRPFAHYVPSALFSPLNFPEVTLVLPREEVGVELDVALALSEFAPLNASKRFARQGVRSEAHWVAPEDFLERVQEACARCSDAVPQVSVDLRQLGSFESESSSFGYPNGIRVLRPRTLQLRAVTEFSDRTRSYLKWQTAILGGAFSGDDAGSASHRLVPQHAAVSTLVKSLCFALHRTGDALTLRRFAERARCTLAASDKEMEAKGLAKDQQVDLVFTDQGAVAAIGFELAADAVGLVLKQGTWEQQDWFVRGGTASAWRRTEFFLQCFRSRWEGHVLATGECLNAFSLDRVSALFLALLGTDVLEDVRRTVRDRLAFYAGQGRDVLGSRLRQLSKFAYCLLDPSAKAPQSSKLSASLDVLISDPSIRGSLVEMACVLHESPEDAKWGSEMASWSTRRAKLAVGATFLSAVGQLLPDLEISTLAIDVSGEGDEGDVVWVSETTPGGVGTIQQILDLINQDEEQFLLQWSDAIQPTGQESVARDLEVLAGELQGSGPVASAASAFRSAALVSAEAQEQSVHGLKVAVEDMGIPWRHGLRVPLLSRMLGAGTTPVMDRWTCRLLAIRGEAAKLPYLMPDLGVLYRMSSAEVFASELEEELGREEYPWKSAWQALLQRGVDEDYQQAWMRVHFSTLLWESVTRQMERDSSVYNRYVTSVSPDLLALREALLDPPEVVLDEREVEEWWPELQQALNQSPGGVRLSVGPTGRPALARAMVQIAVQQVDYEFTRSFVRPMGVHRDERGWFAVVCVMEFRR